MAQQATQHQPYPTLEEMGVQRPHEIAHYTLRSVGEKKDILKIHYQRAPGSFLPETRKYTFGRSMKTIIADGGTARMEHVYEISPFLLKATAELDSLVEHRQNQPQQTGSEVSAAEKEGLLQELDALEELVAAGVKKTDAATISARFSRFRARVANL